MIKKLEQEVKLYEKLFVIFSAISFFTAVTITTMITFYLNNF